ncbi:MAG TPA: hypothetical protein VME01_04565 [Solirubrobacteraceae bacterium]|nr:hypothetical protein [Solirubrobacteraceae bacterium]
MSSDWFKRHPQTVLALVLVVAVALAAVLASGKRHRAGDPRAAPALGVVAHAQACPASDAAQVRQLEGGGGGSSAAANAVPLVPAGANSMLVCRYNGLHNPPPINLRGKPAYALIASARLAGARDAVRITAIVNGLNAIPVRTGNGEISCPADLDRDLLVYFGYPSSSRMYRYTIDIDGCQQIASGRVRRLGLDAAVVGALVKLVPVRGVTA